ncbi:hypothetical protein PMF13cell1_02497 [Blautia producta]|uniref:Uncharacterized protein n=1 Tax=Blautia producta TaxID=33035 RepID=A0A4P6M071_9FIRM|nr:hypothetical protein [Blautia producta]QBE96950.1 hypothetical protein PMF13cell1_02497 [Blautia producta]
MKKTAKGIVPIIIYELLIILMMYGADNNLDMYFLLYVPYQYFLCSIYAFFVGRAVQKMSTVKTFTGRMMFAVLIVLLTLYNNYLWFCPDYVLRDDTYINVILSFIGFLIGEIYQYNKQQKEK